jgi:hypothetical protein
MVSLLAMLFLVIFSTLALGFYATATMSSQVAANERKTNEARLAAESGLRFIRYQLSTVNISAGLSPDKAFEDLYIQLAGHLEGTANLGSKVVGYTAPSAGVPAEIRIPDRAADYVNVSAGGPRFRVVITNASPLINVKCVGAAAGGPAARALRVLFQRAPKPYSLVGISSMTLSGSAFTDSYDASKGPYVKANARSAGSIASNGTVTLKNTAKVNGDVRYGLAATASISPTAAVTGITAPVFKSVSYPSVTMPPAGTYTDLGDVTQSSGTINVPGGTYLINNLTLSGTAKINWTGPVKLYIKSGYNVSGSVAINTFNNLPVNRQLFFLPTCKTATWSGTNVCVGDLYAPDTDFTVSGGVEKMGRIIAKSITNSSTGGMHYDESLPSPNGLASFSPVADSYVEVTP